MSAINSPHITFHARPYAYTFPRKNTALLVIDMQRDFILPGGYGAIEGGDLSAVQASVAPTKALLDACRGADLHVFHTREGQVPSLADCPSSKLVRQAAAPGNTQHSKVIGDEGEMGRLLVRGEYGHDFVDELRPLPGEVVIDKPCKGAFWNTNLMHKLKARAITHLLVAGVTTECCFANTIREANDRGFECCAVAGATAGYNAAFKTATLDMICWSQGLFGFVAELQSVLDALLPHQLPSPPTQVSSGSHLTEQPWDGNLDVSALQQSYARGVSVVTVVEALYERITKHKSENPNVWICLYPKEGPLETARCLEQTHPTHRPPLFGVPFTVKDCFEVEGILANETCEELIEMGLSTASCIEKLEAAGAMLLGKVNQDQLSLSLTGCDSPFGTNHSVFSSTHISGGSNSGSAISVGADLVTFSLVTDVAGCTAVSSAFNGAVGFKPTKGLIPFDHIYPTCLSLDTVGFIARNVEDARLLWQECEGYEERNQNSRDTFPMERHVNSIGPQQKEFTFGIPPPEILEMCSQKYQTTFKAVVKFLQTRGGRLADVDWQPFKSANQILSNGFHVLQKLAMLPKNFLETNQPDLQPAIRDILRAAEERYTRPTEIFNILEFQKLDMRYAIRQFASADKEGLDVIVVPSTPDHPTIEATLRPFHERSPNLGMFCQFGNFLDLCAVTVPVCTYEDANDSGVKLPFSVTFFGARCTDSEVLNIASRFAEQVKEQ